jgi:hypothetical protein
MSPNQKNKNNHFVPQSYLERFHSVSDRQVALYNLKSGRTIETAPIKTQCSRDYFYTRNPIFEDRFSEIEGRQKRLFAEIITKESVPATGSIERSALSTSIMFQEGRTVTAVQKSDHLTNQFGKAMLRARFEADGNTELLEYLPQVNISQIDGVMESVLQHLLMAPLIDDLDCTLFINKATEDFLTSDHPIALCNNLPATSALYGANVGFSSRGLIILFPLSPRALLFLSDSEVYRVAKANTGAAVIANKKEVVELNLAQCLNAFENLYFSSTDRVKESLVSFRDRRESLRKARPSLKETTLPSGANRKKVLLQLPSQTLRLSLPKIVAIRLAVAKSKYVLGDAFERNPARTLASSDGL